MEFIILDTTKKDIFLREKSKMQSDLTKSGVDYFLIPLKNGFYILPLSIISDPLFDKLLMGILKIDIDFFSTQQEVSADDFINTEN